MKQYLIEPGMKIEIEKLDPRDQSAFEGTKKESKEVLNELNLKIAAYQEKLFAEHKQKLLVILQAIDTGGKDGTIRHVFGGINPQGVRVANFKVPSEEEMDHDFLWRVHKQVPANGELVIFNRSHYEDVLVVRVHNLVEKSVWSERYDQINDFERLLVQSGTTILKFFLHISPEEQKERLDARLLDPDKRWKFRKEDLKERERWPDYMKAYESMLNKTSTECAPWYWVPGDRKWYRNLVISTIVVDTLKKMDPVFPEPEEDLDGVVVE